MTLYSSIKSPFSSSEALNIKNIPIVPASEGIALRPRVDLLSKFQSYLPVDNTETKPQETFNKIDIPTAENKKLALPSQLSPPKDEFSFDKFKALTGMRESSNNYKATNETATGKYQFLWDVWSPKIRATTGIKSRKQFLNSPKAQEDFFKYYTSKTILPAVKKLAETGKNLGLTQVDVARAVHLRGAVGAERLFAQGLKGLKKDTSRNPSILDYLKK